MYPNEIKTKKSKTPIIIIVSILAVIALVVGGYALYEYNTTKNIPISKKVTYEYLDKEMTCSVYSIYPQSDNGKNDFVIKFSDDFSSPSGEVIYSDTSTTFKDIGTTEHEITIFFPNNLIFKKSVCNIVVEVVDTAPPVFMDNVDKVAFVKDCKTDLTSKFKAKDLTEVTIRVDDSAVDYSKAGTYKALAVATDISGNTVQKEFLVVVKEPVIKLSEKEVELRQGDTEELSVKVAGKETEVKWKSSNEKVATVKDGKIEAKREGTCTISASANGATAECKIIVSNKEEQKTITDLANKYKSGNITNKKESTTKKSDSTTTTTTKSKFHTHVYCKTGKYFNTSKEAIAYYQEQEKTWKTKYEQGQITLEEYIAYTPTSYRLINCDCGKVGIEFFYNH